MGSAALAGVTAVAGAIRVYAGTDLDERIGTTTLTYFAVAGALLMLRKIKSLSFGDYKAEFQEVQEKAESAMELAKTAESMARTMPAQSVASLLPQSNTIQPGRFPDDPWKGQFGSSSESNFRRLSAEVKPIKDEPDWFLLRLTVESTDPEKPVVEPVQFFIHDTFPNYKPIVHPFGGIAELRLRAWGAFTVGVLVDAGRTKLELDLEKDKAFPPLFRSR